LLELFLFFHDYFDILAEEWLNFVGKLLDSIDGCLEFHDFLFLSIIILVYTIINEDKLIFLQVVFIVFFKQLLVLVFKILFTRLLL
jgi:hypothetical protein